MCSIQKEKSFSCYCNTRTNIVDKVSITKERNKKFYKLLYTELDNSMIEETYDYSAFSALVYNSLENIWYFHDFSTQATLELTLHFLAQFIGDSVSLTSKVYWLSKLEDLIDIYN